MQLVLHYWALVLSLSASAAVAHDFIMELDSQSTRSFKKSLDSVSSSLKRSAINYEITKSFTSDGIFHGAVVKLNDAADADAIAKMSEVKAIRRSLLYEAPKPLKMQIVSNLNDASIPVDTGSTHTMTGVDKVHADGNIGKGVKIGIIDTGVDYTHPSLGGGFGPGFKVVGGFDFVGDAFNGTGGPSPVPDTDPLDTCNGHGTFVAGILGADPGNKFNISGVAFGASLSAYRVFGCTGDTSDDIIIDALLKGVQDKQDILTLSLGAPSGWAESTTAVVVDRIVAAGIVVTASAGNDGASGPWYAAGPSTGIHAISVASVDNTVYLASLRLYNATVNASGSDHAPIQYHVSESEGISPINTTSALPIYATSTNTSAEADACNPLPDSTPDLSSFLVVIRRGNCTFVQKVKNIKAKGAKFAFIYNNVDGPLSPGIPGNGNGVSAAGIEAADGVFLVQQFAAGVPTSLSFPQDVISFNDPHGGLMSAFSSYGPTFDLFFKPTMSAPGGNITSTFPVDLGSFAMLSGTSMSTPFVAGCAALLLSSKGRTKQVAGSALSLFESTAQKIPSSTNKNDPLQTLIQQGAGLIDVFAAINTTTTISPTELLLNSTAHFKPVQTFMVENKGTQAKNYTLVHVPAGTAMTVEEGSIFTAHGPIPLSSKFATVEITPSNFTVQPGKTQTVQTKFMEPTGLDPKTFPVYSGFIEVNSGSESLHAVYLGMVGDLKTKQVLDNTSSFLGFQIPAITNFDLQPQPPTNYTFNGTDNPTLLYRMSFGSPHLFIDLVDASTDHISSSGPFSDDKVVGSIQSNTSVPRNSDDMSSNNTIYTMVMKPTFLNGSTIPNGSYRLLLRALRVTGNPDLEEDYDSALTGIFGVKVLK